MNRFTEVHSNICLCCFKNSINDYWLCKSCDKILGDPNANYSVFKDREVYILHNDLTGDTWYSVGLFGTEIWLDSFVTEKQARKFCRTWELKIKLDLNKLCHNKSISCCCYSCKLSKLVP